jgi:hypothetical protein
VAEEDGLGGEHAQENGLHVANGRRYPIKIVSANPAEPEKGQEKTLSTYSIILSIVLKYSI